jgi:hypothetical protein
MPGGPGIGGGRGGANDGGEIDGPLNEGPLTNGIPGGRQPEPRAQRQHTKMK